MITGLIVAAMAGYLLGSIPTGFLLGRLWGIDIRAIGSGNIGATNAFRALGAKGGAIVLLVDAAKGWLAATVAAGAICSWFWPEATTRQQEWFAILAGLCAILGHNYTCWLRFKGGKGIATSAGVLLALAPWPLLVGFVVWMAVFALTRYASLASILGALALPPAALLAGQTSIIIGIASVMAALAVYQHRTNIKRLLKGTESRIGRPKAAVPPQPRG